MKDETYFREIMERLIQRFNDQKKEINQDKLNQITYSLCNSIMAEKVFIEFASIFQRQSDLDFVQDIIETLTFAIAASPNYKEFRAKLFGSVATTFAKD
jgi:hypothetical protein